MKKNYEVEVAELLEDVSKERKIEREKYVNNIGKEFILLKNGKELEGIISGVTTNYKGEAFYLVRYIGSKKRKAIRVTNKNLKIQ